MQATTTPLRGKTILVTGGVAGLGLGCALRFAGMGANLVLADRNEGTAAAALQQLDAARGGGRHEFHRVDLSDAADVRRAAGEVLARGRPLDVLVNNAGIYPPSQRTLNAEGIELTLAIAHFGHFRLTHALLPLLRAARNARVVTVTSLTHRRAHLDLDDLGLQHGYMPIRAYARAKLANLLFALELQRRLHGVGILSLAAHPGVTRTSIGRNRRIAADDRWYQRFSSAFFAYTQARLGQSPEQGAEPVVLAATDPDIAPGAFLGPTGFLEASGPVRVVQPSPTARDPGLARRLWEKTEAVTGLYGLAG
ncbi:MAG: SDR family NAD(P)-dependent oxidoreductase [Nevskia sp.]|nr:SDR family NAD(P)-dependent oxidoreductase [Nevskia sp.]